MKRNTLVRPAVIFASLLLVGVVERLAIPTATLDLGRAFWQLVLVQRELFVLAGLAGLVLVAMARFGGKRGRALFERAWLTVPGLLLGGLLFLGVGEVAVRVMFWGGIPFSGGGPIVRDFEANFVHNRFEFEGSSRGPQYDTGERLPPGPRILVQGDSITWGAGIAREEDLYTSRLLERIRRERPLAELSSLAFSGREIDGHRRVLAHYGDALRPDVIVYQWYVNDLEVDASLRPRRGRWWRRSDIHRVLVQHSYFWFFVDNRLNGLLPGPPVSYTGYMLDTFGSDTEAWKTFRNEFVAWASNARRLTPHVVVLLYPAVNQQLGFWPEPLHARVSELAERQGVTVLDFIQRCEPWKDDYSAMYASPFDRHPNEEVHEALADALADVVLPLLDAEPADSR